MDNIRYDELFYSRKNLSKKETGLTDLEKEEGWHWCPEFDDQLIGPGMQVAFFCNCDFPPLEKWKATLEGLEMERAIEDQREIIGELYNFDQGLGLMWDEEYEKLKLTQPDEE